MIDIAPVSWLDWGLGTDEDAAPSLPQVDMLAAHNAVTADPRKEISTDWTSTQPGPSRRTCNLFSGTAARDGTPTGTGQSTRGW